MTGIKTMGLYGNVERIMADLAAVGIADDAPLQVDDLVPFDQYHYHGAEAVDVAAAALGATTGQQVLDVGSGLGGPARYLADRTGATVTALELQPDLDAVARSLTQRCGLEPRVEHVNGNILDAELGDRLGAGRFDAMMSMLCILHIPDRPLLFERCAAALRGEGRVFVEDFYARGPFTAHEQDLLGHEVSCPYLPSLDAYRHDLEAAGFVHIVVEDMTEDWTWFVANRLEAFRDRRVELTRRYNQQTFDSLDRFYDAVSTLFAGGNLGGLRLTATRVT